MYYPQFSYQVIKQDSINRNINTNIKSGPQWILKEIKKAVSFIQIIEYHI